MTNFVKEFREANEAFNTKYDEVIKKIATFNGVDMSVGSDMFKTNLHFDATLYSGGGVVESEVWQEMLKDYKDLHSIASNAKAGK